MLAGISDLCNCIEKNLLFVALSGFSFGVSESQDMAETSLRPTDPKPSVFELSWSAAGVKKES